MIQRGIMSIYGGLVPLGFSHSNVCCHFCFPILLKIAYHILSNFTTSVFNISQAENL